MSEEALQIRRLAMDLLARREHSYVELQRKLQAKQLATDVIKQELDKLKSQGLLSDQRFLQSFIRTKAYSGKGPQRIREELLHKGISSEAISIALDEADIDWQEILLQVWQKRFNQKPMDAKEKAKQGRFLAYRGFEMGQIMRLIN